MPGDFYCEVWPSLKFYWKPAYEAFVVGGPVLMML